VNEMSVAKAGEQDSDAGKDVQGAHDELWVTGDRVAQIAGMAKESFQLAVDSLQFRKRGESRSAYAHGGAWARRDCE
jgi:hypothetical protein